MSVDARIALNRLTSALERHYEVIVAAHDSNEDAIERAYYQLQDALLTYQEILDTQFEEVLPYEVVGDE